MSNNRGLSHIGHFIPANLQNSVSPPVMPGVGTAHGIKFKFKFSVGIEF